MKKLIALMLIMMLSFTCLPAWAEDVPAAEAPASAENAAPERKTVTAGKYTVTYDDEIDFLPADGAWEIYGSARITQKDGVWTLRDSANYGANLMELPSYDWNNTDCTLLVYDFTLKGTFATVGVMLDWWELCITDLIADQYGIPVTARGGDESNFLPAGTYQGVLDVTELLRNCNDATSEAAGYANGDLTFLNVYLVTGQAVFTTLKLVSGAEVIQEAAAE